MKFALRISAAFCTISLIAAACDEPNLKEWATTEAHPHREELSGVYYQGDGLGMNVILYLSRDASFYQSWSGCLGLYGEAAGGWSLQDSVVHLKSQFRTGFLVEFPESLLVMQFHDTLSLLAASDTYRETYRKLGADQYTLLQKLSGDTTPPMSALADLDGDRISDLVVGANNDTSFSLRVYLSAMSDSAESDSLVFRHWRDGCQDCLCSGSGAFNVETMYSLDSILDSLPPGYVVDSSCAQIEVYSFKGECDRFHCYWDRKRHKLGWWSL